MLLLADPDGGCNNTEPAGSIADNQQAGDPVKPTTSASLTTNDPSFHSAAALNEAPSDACCTSAQLAKASADAISPRTGGDSDQHRLCPAGADTPLPVESDTAQTPVTNLPSATAVLARSVEPSKLACNLALTERTGLQTTTLGNLDSTVAVPAQLVLPDAVQHSGPNVQSAPAVAVTDTGPATDATQLASMASADVQLQPTSVTAPAAISSQLPLAPDPAAIATSLSTVSTKSSTSVRLITCCLLLLTCTQQLVLFVEPCSMQAL